jgi:coenzyme F420-reducing hydrogenase gamma subunit
MKKQRIGVFKFTSCDGCQLSILNLEEELFDLIESFDIAYFREALDKAPLKQYDIGIVEGSISTDRQKEEIIEIREKARFLITIGACATAGGVQALRNWANLADFKRYVYPSPELVDALPMSTPISDHVYLDYELWGCPINKESLSETLISLLVGKRPGIPVYSLCMDCKIKGIPCVLVSRGEPCLGPVTRAGCGSLCPSFARACYGCFGPKEEANIDSLMGLFEELGLDRKETVLLMDKMNTYAYRRARFEKAH